jgi:hypothetical protein
MAAWLCCHLSLRQQCEGFLLGPPIGITANSSTQVLTSASTLATVSFETTVRAPPTVRYRIKLLFAMIANNHAVRRPATPCVVAANEPPASNSARR